MYAGYLAIFSSVWALIMWSVLGAIGVGLGEEMITRGALLVGLRTNHMLLVDGDPLVDIGLLADPDTNSA